MILEIIIGVILLVTFEKAYGLSDVLCLFVSRLRDAWDKRKQDKERDE